MKKGLLISVFSGALISFLILLSAYRSLREPLTLFLTLAVSFPVIFLLFETAGIGWNMLSLGGLLLGTGMLLDSSNISISSLIRTEKENPSGDYCADSLDTSLGYPVIKNGTVWEIDLSHLRIFTGLSVLARIIGDTVIDAVENDSGDISFLYKINPNINPELLVMQVYYIQIYAKSGVLDNVLLFKEEFHEHLRAVFGTFQRPVWGSQIHPEFYGEDSKTSPPRALVFPFHYVSQSDDIDYHFILERAENRKHRGRFFFRLTIEKQSEATYQYENRPYSIVDDLRTRVFIAGSTKMAESLSEKLQSACKKGSDSYSEENLVLGHVFEQLSKTGIGAVDQINFQWDKEFSKFMLNTGKEDRLVIIKRLFLCLEDNVLCDLLLKGETVMIRLGRFSIYLFLTRLSRVLNFSINRERNYLTLDMYLKRMPKLETMADKTERDLDFSG
ncbi:MAG TPA: TMEM14 family protein, partial [Leptospiraceae bacterium]|nr:TMEM14 family protein [Leptospiraceae bacterium]